MGLKYLAWTIKQPFNHEEALPSPVLFANAYIGNGQLLGVPPTVFSCASRGPCC